MLSGIALEHVYHARALGRGFAVARIARLAPLWVPVVLVSSIAYGLTNPWAVALNVTGAFGFIPGYYSLVAGGWSIGMELVFYALFPLLRALSTRWLLVLVGAAYLLRTVWVHAVWSPGLTIHEVWTSYTLLPSFLVFFVLGIALARLGDRTSWTGRRAALATVLGDLSYGTYLLHPLVYAGTRDALTTIVVTPALALAIHGTFEVPVGRRLRRWLSSEGPWPAPLRHRHPVAVPAIVR